MSSLFAQGSADYNGGLRIKLNDEGSKYLRFIIWNQVWARYTHNNPGTAINGQSQEHSFDLGARRLRFLAYAQISSRYLILTHFGINNQTFIGGGAPGGGITGNGGTGTLGKKPGIFFHDIWNEYTIFPQQKERPFSLAIGAGLHYWNGVSRMASASTLNFLAVDAPIFNWYNIELSDQFARQFGVYAKGKLYGLDYRLSLNRPFATNQTPPSSQGAKVLNQAVDNNSGSPIATAGYLMYQFFDQESNQLPFTVGSYLGTKKVFNIGLGFYRSPKGTMSYALSGTDTIAQRHAITNLGLDVFVDLPLGKAEENLALTAYSMLAHYDYGPNYQRNVGIMNIGAADPRYTGEVSSAGFGNARPLMGTGWISYTQLGLLLPKSWLNQGKQRLQLFGAYTLMNLQHLDRPISAYDFGLNYLIDGHHAKITLQYSARPLMFGRQSQGHRGELILQTQVYL
jgi:hypothetical protein